MRARGIHGSDAGEGKILAHRGTEPLELEYSYSASNGGFRGSISVWERESDGMGLIAYMSRELPTQRAMLDWIFQKAEKITTTEE